MMPNENILFHCPVVGGNGLVRLASDGIGGTLPSTIQAKLQAEMKAELQLEALMAGRLPGRSTA